MNQFHTYENSHAATICS